MDIGHGYYFRFSQYTLTSQQSRYSASNVRGLLEFLSVSICIYRLN